MGKQIAAEIRETGSPHFQSQSPRVVHTFVNPKGHQMLYCFRLGIGLGTRERLFVSVKINYIFGFCDLQI